MRTYGRITDELGNKKWIEVTTDVNGFNDYVWITTLIQCLKLVLGESPFHADYGIPALRSVITQVQPDYYVTRTQQQFAPYFASLIITKLSSTTPAGQAPTPTWRVNVLTNQGVQMALNIPV